MNFDANSLELDRGSSGVQIRANSLQPVIRSPFRCHDNECNTPLPKKFDKIKRINKNCSSCVFIHFSFHTFKFIFIKKFDQFRRETHDFECIKSENDIIPFNAFFCLSPSLPLSICIFKTSFFSSVCRLKSKAISKTLKEHQ